jgi:hypothetical protein
MSDFAKATIFCFLLLALPNVLAEPVDLGDPVDYSSLTMDELLTVDTSGLPKKETKQHKKALKKAKKAAHKAEMASRPKKKYCSRLAKSRGTCS